MASMTDYLESKIRDHVLRNIAYTSPSAVYLALYTVAPTDAGGGTEAAGGSYGRQAVTIVAGGAAGEGTTSAAVDYLNMPAATIVAAAFLDALMAGNMLLHAALTVPKTVSAGDTLSFAAGDIDVIFT